MFSLQSRKPSMFIVNEDGVFTTHFFMVIFPTWWPSILIQVYWVHPPKPRFPVTTRIFHTFSGSGIPTKNLYLPRASILGEGGLHLKYIRGFQKEVHLDLKESRPFLSPIRLIFFSKPKNGDVDVLMLPPKQQTFHRKSWKSHKLCLGDVNLLTWEWCVNESDIFLVQLPSFKLT